MTDPTPTITSLPLAFAQGTSQADRSPMALNPDYVAVDERSLQDVLAFVRSYAKQLRYFNLNDQPEGDWRGLLPDTLDLNDVVAFVNNPDAIPQDAALYRRPHFVLLLSVLKLLEQNRANLNTLTQRHLDFYYRDVLQLKTRPAQADHLHVLLEPAKHINFYKLPALTRLNAGKDSSGKTRIYQTDRDVVVSHAKIASLRTLRADVRHIDVRTARDRHLKTHGITRYFDAFMEMFKVAYGEPLAGGTLPDFVCNATTPVDHKTMNVDQLKGLYTELQYISNTLHMSFTDFEECATLRLKRIPPRVSDSYSDIPELVGWRKQWEQDWKTINGILNTAGQNPTNPAHSTFTPIDELSTDFDGNFKKAIGTLSFAGLPNIENLADLYHRRSREDAIEFRQTYLHALQFPDPANAETSGAADAFECLMQIKTRIDNEWERLYDLLEQTMRVNYAARQKANDANAALPTLSRRPEDFDAGLLTLLNFAQNTKTEGAAVPSKEALQAATLSLISKYQIIRCLERYTALSAFEIKQLMDIVQAFNAPDDRPHADRWLLVDTLLNKGSAKKRNDRRKQTLINVVTDDQGNIKEGAEAVAALLSTILGAELDASTVGMAIDKLQAVYVQIDLAPLKYASLHSTIEPQEWQKIYQMLASAWGMFRGESSKPAKVEWQNLYAYQDAKASTVSLGIAEDNTPRWNTFGGVPTGIKPKELAEFGWALSSPLLLLNEGKREITLTLSFDAHTFNQAGIESLLNALRPRDRHSFFKLLISTGKDWLEPTADNLSINIPATGASNPNQLIFRFSYPSDAAAITAPATDMPLAGNWPVLKIVVNPLVTTDPYIDPAEKDKVMTSHYLLFKPLQINAINLKVAVTGLKTFQAWNDERTVDPTKPFEPFGTRPATGSRFYVTHPELVCKKLSSVAFNTEWMDKPADMAKHYKNYPAITSGKEFEATISLYEPQYGLELAAAQKSINLLMNPEPTDGLPKDPKIKLVADLEGNNRVSYERQLALPDRNKRNQDSRYLQWELRSPDFQHSTYPKLALEKSTQLAIALGKSTTTLKAEDYQVNPPYTPKLKSLTLDYVAEETIDCLKQNEASAEQLFHLEPFGYAPLMAVDTGKPLNFLPQFNREGELYIGLEKLNPPQNLSLLLQVAEGSANADLEPAVVEWHYLSGNRWLKLDDGSLISDATRGLIHTGIVELSLKPAEPNTLLPSHLYWLRASVVSRSGSVCNTVDIHCQAVSATFVDQANAPDHYQTPLPVDSISKLEQPRMEIKAIRQPYTSYGAKQAEQDEHFYTRVSERLRHKNRALTAWDYERLILEQFPSIYRAKCIPAEQGKPGDVSVVVIPDIKNRVPFDPSEPKAPLNLLDDINTYLRGKAPITANINARNAVYIPLIIRAGICFKPGMPGEFNKKTLNQALDRFFSPWAFDKGDNIKLGGEIHVNSIIKFIEDQEYVDFVSKISLFKTIAGRHIPIEVSKNNSITPDHGDEVFVSSGQHEFDIISDVDYREVLFDGLGNMRLELDFHLN